MDENITELYKGTVRIKKVETNWGHQYWKAEKVKGVWDKYVRVKGVTNYIGIKDKSFPLKIWVARIMRKFLKVILLTRSITKYDVDEAEKLHTIKLAEAATSGTKIHDWIEQFVKGKKPDMPEEEEILRGVNAFLDIVKEKKLKFLDSEFVVYSKEYGYCGSADALSYFGTKKNEVYLGDYKTSKGLYNDVMLQTAAYAHAKTEESGLKIKGRWAMRIEKRSEVKFRDEMEEKGKIDEPYLPVEFVLLDYDKGDQQSDFQAFLCAKGLKIWEDEAKKKIEAYKAK